MRQTFLSLGLIALLTACGGDTDEANPVSGGPNAGADGIPVDEDGNITGNDDIPEDLAMNLEGVDFSPASETLVISIGGLDSGTDTSTYVRAADLDVPGFTAFTKQDDPLDRFFIAQAALAPSGSSQAFAITDGGQFNRFFGGTRFERLGEYTQPTTGLVSYAGTYAGSTNTGERNTPQLLPTPDGLSTSVLPRQPHRVRGEIFVNVDFSENKINGEIYNRVLIDHTGEEEIFTAANGGQFTASMPNVSLVVTDIAADGTFEGEAEEAISQDPLGEYAGTFGGTNANSVAIGVHLDRFSDDLENEEEYGAAALARCGTAGDAAICDDL